jgi:ligand-binding sensor domain-containing protein/signal transduction histidine kinase/DNA-binding response OmpR family regulator
LLKVPKKQTFLKNIILIAAITLTVCRYTVAQPHYFKHYQVEEGLSYNTVFCSIQDSKGFMWFGTRDGLNRFDGYNFKVFRHEQGNKFSLGSNFISTLCEDGRGHIWVGTNKGLYSYDVNTEKFTVLNNTLGKGVRFINKDSKGNLWFVINRLLNCYNIFTSKFTTYNIDKKLEITSLTCTPNDEVWVSADNGTIKRYNVLSNSYSSFDMFAQSPHAMSKHIEKIYYAGDDRLLIGTTYQGVKLFDIKTSSYKDIIAYNSDKTEIFARDFLTNGHEYWLATESGIFIYDTLTKKITNIKKDYNNFYSLSDNAVYSLYKDKQGGIWAGTYFGGANFYSAQNSVFEKYFPCSSPNSVKGNVIGDFCEDKNGNIWIGTEDAGVNKLNPRTGLFQNFTPDGNKGSIAYTNIHGLVTQGNELWIGTFQHGLDVMDINTNKVVRHYGKGNKPGDLKDNFINTLYQTPHGDLLIGTARGLYKYIRATDSFEYTNYTEPYSLIYNIQEDSRRTIWIGTLNDGLYYYNAATGSKGHYVYDANNPDGISSNTVTSTFEDSDKNLWFTTENGGICRYLPASGTFKKYMQDGLKDKYLYRIVEDNKKILWITTSKGLVSFNRANNETAVYRRANGLLSDQFNYCSSFKDSYGNLYFGSVKGFIKFDPSKLMKNTVLPPVYITSFQVDNKEIEVGPNNSSLTTSISSAHEITLKPSQSSFSIDYAALSYNSPKMIYYAYKLENIDKDWNYLPAKRRIYFTKLPSGTYTFKIKVVASRGELGSQESTLIINVLPPFYASIWAYLIYTILVTLGVFFAVQSYHNWLLKKSRRKMALLQTEKEKEIYEAKIEFFTHITHEIRTPLTLIQGPIEKAKQSTNLAYIHNNLSLVEKNTTRLLNLVDQLLDFRRTEVNGFSLNFSKTNVSAAVTNIFLLFKDTAEHKDLNYLIDLPDQDIFAYIDAEALNKILSNLLNNAIKYAESSISMRFFMAESGLHFIFEISNDGHIIPPNRRDKVFEAFYRLEENNSKSGTGIGLPLARALAELHNGTLQLSTLNAGFNTFKLVIPIHQEMEFDLDFNEDHVEDAIEDPAINTPEDAKLTLLLVEDHQDILNFIAIDLMEKYTVLKAANGKEALDVLNNSIVHIIISDVMMPVMDGFELCKTVKSDINHSHIPVILLTAKNSVKAKLEGLELGADAYVAKPFSPEHLALEIFNLLRNRDLVKNYYANSPLIHLKSVAHSKADEDFLQKLNDLINVNLANIDFDVDDMANYMNISRPTLFRKIKAIANLSPHDLINITRLKKAAELIAEGNHKIYEVAEIAGFSQSSVFTRAFHKQFGMPPSEYANAHRC